MGESKGMGRVTKKLQNKIIHFWLRHGGYDDPSVTISLEQSIFL